MSCGNPTRPTAARSSTRSTSTSTSNAPTSGATLIRHHLDECSPCLREYGIEQEVKALVARCCGGEKAPEALRERLRAKLNELVVQVETPALVVGGRHRSTATRSCAQSAGGRRATQGRPGSARARSGPYPCQELGRLPWLAALFLRAFFLRDFFAMVASGLGVVATVDRSRAIAWSHRPCRSAARAAPLTSVPCTHDWIPSRDMSRDERGTRWPTRSAPRWWRTSGRSSKAGDAVAEGDTLVILESMKMEIPVVAESDGMVKQIAVNEGDVVQEGDLIAVIE